MTGQVSENHKPPSEDLNRLLALHKNGQFYDAEILALSITKYFPQHSLGWQVLGDLFRLTGRKSQALKAHQVASQLIPEDPGAHFNLGISFQQLEDIEQAEASYIRCIELKPDFARAHYNLGTIYQDTCRLEDAKESYNLSIKFDPNYAPIHNNLGNVLKDLDQLDEALESYHQAITLKPDFLEAHCNLGYLFRILGRFEESETSYRISIQIKPDFAEALNDLGYVLEKMGRFQEAQATYREAITVKPKLSVAYRNLGVSLISSNKLDEAEQCYRRALDVNPDDAAIYQYLGELLRGQGRLEEALARYRDAERIDSSRHYLSGDKILVTQMLCEWDKTSQELDEITTGINNSDLMSSPFNLQLLVSDAGLLRKCAEIYSRDKFPKSTFFPSIEPYKSHDKIRIGYFSCDFCTHPVTTGIADLFKLHDREKFEVHAFSFGLNRRDTWNSRVRENVDVFHDVHGMPDKDIVMFSRSLEIDIAVDLTGHTKGSRTELFAMSVAPLQLGYVGFLGTMGASYYDYIIADRVLIPEKSKDYYCEKIVYLPSYQVHSKQLNFPNNSIDREYFDIPNDVFVFCCFNQSCKITSDDFDSWAHILSQVKNSILVLSRDNDQAARNLEKEMSIRGIVPERLILSQRLSGSEYWSRYRAVDLFLDTFHYSAGMTAGDALRSGCPLLTCLGESFSSRFGGSILTALGLTELITTTTAEYEELAVHLATHPRELKTLKEKLAANIATERLYDTQMFADSIEAGFSQMHDKCQKGMTPDDIYIS